MTRIEVKKVSTGTVWVFVLWLLSLFRPMSVSLVPKES